MHRSLLKYLACRGCGADFALAETHVEAGHVMEGALACRGCGETHPVRGGVPRFVNSGSMGEQRATAENFGYQWRAFRYVGTEGELKQFKDWIAPHALDSFRGKVVLDGGCGKGRHPYFMLQNGVGEIVGVDLSDAVDAAFANLRDFPNAHVLQADIFRLPLKPVFDYVYSFGVVHHTPDPEAAFRALAGLVRPGGSMGVMVYGRENNGFVVHAVTPLRKLAVKLLPSSGVRALGFLMTLILYPILKGVYLPVNKWFPNFARRCLFYNAYFSYIAPFPFREIHLIVYDHLNAPIAFYTRREEFEAWFERAGLAEREIIWRNQNTWQGHARRPPEEVARPAARFA